MNAWMLGTSSTISMNQSRMHSKICVWNARLTSLNLALCGIGIDDNGCGGLRDRLWQEIGGENFKDGADVTQSTQYLQGVHFLKFGREFTYENYEDWLVEFYVQEARDRLGQWLIEFQIDPVTAVLGVGRIVMNDQRDGMRVLN